MHYSGLDIQLKEFKKSVRGYDIQEVKNFLDEISKQIESLNFENKVLKDKLREKELLFIDYKQREDIMKETMVTAQKITEGIKQESTREALQIVNQAKIKAESIYREARNNMRTTLDEVNRLKKLKTELISNLKTTIESHLRILNNYEEVDDRLVELNLPIRSVEKRIWVFIG